MNQRAPNKPAVRSSFGATSAQRKQANLLLALQYFHDALAEVGRVILAGQQQHGVTGWDRSKSGDELEAMLRHTVDAGFIDNDGERHTAKAAFRVLAALQKELERDLDLPLSVGSVAGDSTLLDR